MSRLRSSQFVNSFLDLILLSEEIKVDNFFFILFFIFVIIFRFHLYSLHENQK